MKNYFLIAVILSILFFSLTAILAYLFFNSADYSLIIHFDSYRGIDLFGDKWTVFGILSVVFLIILINLFLALVFYNRDQFLSLILGFSTVIFSALILIGVGVMIIIN